MQVDKYLIQRVQCSATGANVHKLNNMLGCYVAMCTMSQGSHAKAQECERIAEGIKEQLEKIVIKHLLERRL